MKIRKVFDSKFIFTPIYLLSGVIITYLYNKYQSKSEITL